MSPTPHPSPLRLAVSLLLLVACSGLAWLHGVPAPAQAPGSEAPAEAGSRAAPDMAEELVRLNATLTRIAQALERQAEGQRLDLSLRRVSVASERVTALERELQSAQAGKTSLENERFHVGSRLSSFAAEAEAALDADTETLQEMERMAAEAQRILRHVELRIEEQDRRILEIENELTRRRADLQALQDRLDRQLDGL